MALAASGTTCWLRASRAASIVSRGSCARTGCVPGRAAVGCRRTWESGPPCRKPPRPRFRGISSEPEVDRRLHLHLDRRRLALRCSRRRPVLPACRRLGDEGRDDCTTRDRCPHHGDLGPWQAPAPSFGPGIARRIQAVVATPSVFTHDSNSSSASAGVFQPKGFSPGRRLPRGSEHRCCHAARLSKQSGSNRL